MELSGHPSADLLAELAERGAVFVEGDRSGPSLEGLTAVPAGNGGWLWVPDAVFDTDMD